MTLRNYGMTLAAAAAATTMAAPGRAATVVSAGDTQVFYLIPTPPVINDITNFAGLVAGQLLRITFSASSAGAINFTTLKFNDKPINLTGDSSSLTGTLTTIAGGTNTLTAIGSSSGFSSFSGNLSVLSATPEAGTWLMMTAGFGLMGAALRKRRVPVPRVG